MGDVKKREMYCNRQKVRSRVVQAEHAFLELDVSEGQRRRLEILNVSATGLLLGVGDEQGVLETGAEFENVVLHIEGIAIPGRITIAHVTQGAFSGTTCGARFKPSTDSDGRRLSAAIERLPELPY